MLFADRLDTFAIPRLTKVVAGDDPRGITEAVEHTAAAGIGVVAMPTFTEGPKAGMFGCSSWARCMARAPDGG